MLPAERPSPCISDHTFNSRPLYIDTTADKSYRWDETGLCYKCIGVGIDDEDELILDNNR